MLCENASIEQQRYQEFIAWKTAHKPEPLCCVFAAAWNVKLHSLNPYICKHRILVNVISHSDFPLGNAHTFNRRSIVDVEGKCHIAPLILSACILRLILVLLIIWKLHVFWFAIVCTSSLTNHKLQRLQKLVYLYLFTASFMKISLQSSEQTIKQTISYNANNLSYKTDICFAPSNH